MILVEQTAKTIAYGRVDRCVVFVCRGGAINDVEWAAYCTYLAKSLQPGRWCALVVGDGLPSASQRQALRAHTSHLMAGARIAVVSDSIKTRGAVTALSWFDSGYRSFARSRMLDALDYLQITDVVMSSSVRDLAHALGEQVHR